MREEAGEVKRLTVEAALLFRHCESLAESELAGGIGEAFHELNRLLGEACGW